MGHYNILHQYLYSSFTTPHLEQRSTIESSPIRKQLCLKSKGLSRFVVAAAPVVGTEYNEPSEFILDCVLDPYLLPIKHIFQFHYLILNAIYFYYIK